MCVCWCLEPAPPRSLYAVNATESSVTLLWTEEGVVDHYQVLCRPSRTSKEKKVSTPTRDTHTLRHEAFFLVTLADPVMSLPQAQEPLMVSAHLLTVWGLQPGSAYNCTVTSFSYSMPSSPAHITITTIGR